MTGVERGTARVAGTPDDGWAWFVGLATLDVIHGVDEWPGPNDKVTSTWHELAAGGPATNAALAFAALGGSARLTTGLGGQAVGITIRNMVEAGGVFVHDVAPEPAVPALSNIILSGRAGHRCVISADGTAMSLPTPSGIPDLGGCKALLVDGHHPGLALWAAHAARNAGVRVVVDAGRWKPVMGELLGLADDVVCSADFRMPGAGTTNALLASLLDMGVRRAAITRGDQPVLWMEKRRDGGPPDSGRLPVAAVEAVDTLAAGDVFHGAYMRGIATSGEDFPGALAFAADVASAKVQVMGQQAWLRRLPSMARREAAR